MDYLMDSFNLPKLPSQVSRWGRSLRNRLMWADFMLSHQESALTERLNNMPGMLVRTPAVGRMRVKRKIKQVQALRARLHYYARQLTGAPIDVKGD